MMTSDFLIRRASVQNGGDIDDFLLLFSHKLESRPQTLRLSEVRKLELLPLVFSLIPRKALSLSPISGQFRPHIIEHLAAIGIERPTNELVMTVKHICEQIVRSNKELAENVGLKVRRKYGVADLRALGLYTPLERNQNGRCTICGIRLAEAPSVELDHIVPFYLMGDLPNGQNWQLLCGSCNNGKRAHLSAMLTDEAWDWIPPEKVAGAAHNSVSLRTRFVTLVTKGQCLVNSCGRGPHETELHVAELYSSALPVPDLLNMLCAEHFEGRTELSLEHNGLFEASGETVDG